LLLVGVIAALGLAVAPAGAAFASGPTITGTGGSYAAVAIDQWASQMTSIYGDNVNYETASSVIGLNDYAQRQVDFGSSEIGYSTGQANDTPPSGTYQYLPDVAGATCFMYNLNGSVGEHITSLRLNSALVEGIFTGTLTRWNAPAIKALNPSIPLPNKPIVTVFRTDASGENYLLGDYLHDEQPSAYAAYSHTLGFPDSPQAIWPYPQQGGRSGRYDFSNWVGQSGSDNASNYVGSTSLTITYVETAYALLHHQPCAYLENASGHFVQPSEKADAVALEKAQLLPDLEQKLAGVYSNRLPETYPMSAYSYLIVPLSPKGTIQAAKGKVLGQFVQYFACAGQQAAGQLGYSPLPPNLVQEDLNGVARITGAAKPPPLSASTCKNPYVDGQTPLPGEPKIIGGGPSVPSGAQGHTASGGKPSTGGPHASGSHASGSAAAASGSHGNSAEPSGGTTTTTPTGQVAGAQGPAATGLYPGQQIVGGLTTGSQLADKSFVGAELQSAARGLGRGSGAGDLTAGGVALLVVGGAGTVLWRRRRRTVGVQP
jgi:phosphate ABC transporter phosphate-binding protein